jgi:uncharacterized protein YndB with AHSA1/START domain
LDVRPTGAIRMHIRGPGGTVYPTTRVYQGIVEPEGAVFGSAALNERGKPLVEVLSTVTLAKQGGRTRQTVRARVVKKPTEAAPFRAAMEAGWTQRLERLDAYAVKA